VSVVDVVTLTKQALPENALSHTIEDDLLLYAVGSRLVARSLVTKEVRWSAPLPDRVAYPAAIAASDERVFVLGNPGGVAGYSLATGKVLFDHELPKTSGDSASNDAATSPRGVAFLEGDDMGLFVTNDGRIVTLPPPQAARAAKGRTYAISLLAMELGPCITYHANEHWEALRCFDDDGRVVWQRDWAEGRLWAAPSSSWSGGGPPALPGSGGGPPALPGSGGGPPASAKHLLLTTQGHVHDDAPRSLVLSARDGRVELDVARASGTLLEGPAGSLEGLLAWEGGRVVHRGTDDAERWSVPYPRRGLVTAARAGEDLVLLAHPVVPHSGDSTPEVVCLDRARHERWRTEVRLDELPREAIGAIRLSIVGDRVVLLTRGRKSTVTVLSRADGEHLLSVP